MAIDSGTFTPEQLARRRRLAEAMLGNSQGQREIVHPMQGVAQLAEAFLGRRQLNQVEEQERRADERTRAQFGLDTTREPEEERGFFGLRRRNKRLANVMQDKPVDEGIEVYGPPEPQQGPPERSESLIPSLTGNRQLDYELYSSDRGSYLRAIAAQQQQKPPEYGFQNVEGTLLRTDSRTGRAEPIYTAQGGGRPLKETLATEEGLRKEFTDLSKDYSTINQSIQTIQSFAQNPSAVGDVSMIYSFMRLIDPRSTVREGEQAQARDAAGVPAQILNLYNRALTGQQLSPEQRSDFVAQAHRIYESQRARQETLVTDYSDIARNAGVDPDAVILDVFRPRQREAPRSQNSAELPEGTIASNPQTGERIVLRNGRWEPM